jgi:hypothetical protein
MRVQHLREFVELGLALGSDVIAQASATSLLHAGRLERHLRLRSLGGPGAHREQEPRLALEGARNHE